MFIGDEIFLGTDSGTVDRVSESNGVRVAEPISPEQLKGSDAKLLPITGIAKDGDRLIVATYGRGVFVFRDGKFSELASTPRPIFVNSVAIDGSGKIWLGTDANKGISGIFRLDNSKAERISAPTGECLAGRG